MREAGLLEELGVEQCAQHRLHFALVGAERRRQEVDRVRIARSLQIPGRHLRLVSDEEVVEVAADEFGAGGLLHDDVDDVLAVEVALVAEERLDAVVMILWPILELPGEAPVGQAGDFRAECPAGERP